MDERSALKHAITQLIRGERSDRDDLLLRIADYQRSRLPAYARLAEARCERAPALPTEVFRFTRVASHPPSQDIRTFRTSGTTNGTRGEHAFRDLELYDLAAKQAALNMLFDIGKRYHLVLLVAPEQDAPDSSLSYMLARFIEWFGASHRYAWPPSAENLRAALDTDHAVALLGTSFALVHAEDALATKGLHFELPPGSRIMQTGGFKGKSRTIDQDSMRAMLTSRYRVDDSAIISEYGMTELSSQMYETVPIGEPRRYHIPHWVRATVVDPETLYPLRDAGGERGPIGILRIDDAANLDSVAALQTADRAQRVHEGFILLGRDASAVPRGCSLAAEEALTTQ